MRQKNPKLTQLEMNQTVTNRLVEEMNDWDEDMLADVFEPLKSELGINISTLQELQALPNKIEIEHYATVLDSILDDIASNDGFGTEQQCDPRGDFRTQEWSMWNVES